MTSPRTKVAIQSIDENLANADSKPLYPPRKGTVDDAGYLFQALDRDDSVDGDKGLYKRDTHKSGRIVRNKERFGFIAFPASPGNGKSLFLVNENSTSSRWNFQQPRTTRPDDQEWIRPSCEED